MLFDLLLSGITLGGMYALIAMGLTIQYGVARIMNLSYGEFLVVAAFVAHFFFTRLGVSPLLTLILVVPIALLVNWLIYRVLLTPLVARAKTRESLDVDSILATFGLLFIVQGVMLVFFGGAYYTYSFLAIPVNVFGITIAANRLTALGFALAFGFGLYFLLTRTRYGTALRAVAVDPNAAQLVAIDVRRASAHAFALGGAMVAAGGVLVSMFLTFSAATGVIFTMKALIVVIMGGIGSLMGCLAAGLMLGIAETLVARLIDPGLTLAVNYALFLAVLIFRPTGLFGVGTR